MKHYQKILLATLLLIPFSNYATGVFGMGIDDSRGFFIEIFLIIFVPVSCILLIIGFLFKLIFKSEKNDLNENETHKNGRSYYFSVFFLSLFISFIIYDGVIF